MGTGELATLAGLGRDDDCAALGRMRASVRTALLAARVRHMPRPRGLAVGASPTIAAVVRFASGGDALASRHELSGAVAALVGMGARMRTRLVEPWQIDTVIPCAVILDTVVRALDLEGLAVRSHGLADALLLPDGARA